jgi:hypothetical protein
MFTIMHMWRIREIGPMGRSRTILTILITVIVIAVLAGAGFALYRLGYAHGLAANLGETLGGRFAWFFSDELPDDLDCRFPQHFEDKFPKGFGGRLPQDFRRSRVPFVWRYQPTILFPWARGITGLLLFVGVVALVVIAVNGLVRTRRSSTQAVVSSSPDEREAVPESDEV